MDTYTEYGGRIHSAGRGLGKGLHEGTPSRETVQRSVPNHCARQHLPTGLLRTHWTDIRTDLMSPEHCAGDSKTRWPLLEPVSWSSTQLFYSSVTCLWFTVGGFPLQHPHSLEPKAIALGRNRDTAHQEIQGTFIFLTVQLNGLPALV